MWTSMIARVRDVIRAATSSTFMHHVRGSLSTRTGTAFEATIAWAQEMIVKLGMITSSQALTHQAPGTCGCCDHKGSR